MFFSFRMAHTSTNSWIFFRFFCEETKRKKYSEALRQTAENKNRKKLLSCLIHVHVINYIIILHARNYCDIWYINNWHIKGVVNNKGAFALGSEVSPTA
jgi:hypothetical protein